MLRVLLLSRRKSALHARCSETYGWLSSVVQQGPSKKSKIMPPGADHGGSLGTQSFPPASTEEAGLMHDEGLP